MSNRRKKYKHIGGSWDIYANCTDLMCDGKRHWWVKHGRRSRGRVAAGTCDCARFFSTIYDMFRVTHEKVLSK